MRRSGEKARVPEIAESVFCIAYLMFDLVAAVVFFMMAGGRQPLVLFGILTLVLGGGDAFHLVPRVIRTFCGEWPQAEWWLGLGLQVSSITMTVFYVLLFYIWKSLFPAVEYPAVLPALIWFSAGIRIVLCFFPQNNWYHAEGNLNWSVYRNLPFAVTGICLAVMFLLSGNAGGYGLWKMSIAIAVSFACYFPVALLAKKKPMVGMLMIPKTMAYIWMVCMGLSLINKVQ